MECLFRLPQHLTTDRARPFEGLDPEQRRTLRIDRDVRRGRRGKPARRRDLSRLLRLMRRPQSDAAGDQRDDEQQRQRTDHPAKAPIAPRLALGRRGECALFGLFEFGGCVEELRLDVGQVRGRRLVAPLQGSFQPGTAVELGVGSAERIPSVRRADQVAEYPLAGNVIVEPCAQSGPRPCEGLVGDLEGVALGGDQSGTDEQADHPVAARVAEDRPARHATADRVAVQGRGDESQQDRAQRVALLGREAVVQAVGRAGDGDPDPATALVALDGERRPVASPPRLGQRVRQQRQRARFPLAVAHQQVDEAGLQSEPGHPCRLLDGLAQRVSAERADEVQSALDEFADVAIDAEATEMVAANDDDDRNVPARPGSERRTEGALHVGCLGEREEFLELVDHPGRLLAGGSGVGEHRGGIGSGREHHHLGAVATKGRNHTGAHQRGLAASRRPGDDEQRCGPQPFDTRQDLGVTTEERIGVVLVIGGKALVRADRACRRHLRDHRERRILAEDRPFEFDQFPSRVDAQFAEHPAGTGDRSERVDLAGTAVLGERQDRPPPLPQRFLVDQAFGERGDLALLARVEAGSDPLLLDHAAEFLPGAPPHSGPATNRRARREAGPSTVPAPAGTSPRPGRVHRRR